MQIAESMAEVVPDDLDQSSFRSDGLHRKTRLNLWKSLTRTIASIHPSRHASITRASAVSALAQSVERWNHFWRVLGLDTGARTFVALVTDQPYVTLNFWQPVYILPLWPYPVLGQAHPLPWYVKSLHQSSHTYVLAGLKVKMLVLFRCGEITDKSNISDRTAKTPSVIQMQSMYSLHMY